MNPNVKRLAPLLALLVIVASGYYGWDALHRKGPGAGFTSGNGRIEATEIDVATKLPGRVAEVLVAEGEFVRAGQPLARMEVQGLQAQRDEALARRQQALHGVAGAEAQVALRGSDHEAAKALLVQRESELDAARRRLARSEQLAEAGSSTVQQLDDDRARVRSAEAAVTRPERRSMPRERRSGPRARTSPGRAPRSWPPRRPSRASTPTWPTAC